MYAFIYYKKAKCFPFYKNLSKSYKCKAVCLLMNKNMSFKVNLFKIIITLLVLMHKETKTRVLLGYLFFEKINVYGYFHN